VAAFISHIDNDRKNMSKQYITTPVGTAGLPFLEEDKKYRWLTKCGYVCDKNYSKTFKAKLLDTIKDHI
jgi:hypothetical protein